MHFICFKSRYFWWKICIRIFIILVHFLVLKYKTTASNSQYHLTLHTPFISLTKCTSGYQMSLYPAINDELKTQQFSNTQDHHVDSRSATRLHREQVHLRGGVWTPPRLRALQTSLSIKLLICSWIAYPPKRGWVTAVDSLVHYQPLCTEFARKYRSSGGRYTEEKGASGVFSNNRNA